MAVDLLLSANNSVINDAQVMPVQNKKTVECLLNETYEKLAGTEANIYLFTTLKGLSLATNDILSFAKKQTLHKRVQKNPDRKVVLSALKSKLDDALSFAKRLRQRRDTLKKKLRKVLGNDTVFRKIQDKLYSKYLKTKVREMGDASRKFSTRQDTESGQSHIFLQ